MNRGWIKGIFSPLDIWMRLEIGGFAVVSLKHAFLLPETPGQTVGAHQAYSRLSNLRDCPPSCQYKRTLKNGPSLAGPRLTFLCSKNARAGGGSTLALSQEKWSDQIRAGSKLVVHEA